MNQRFKFSTVIAWFLCGVACLTALFSLGDLLIQHGQSENILKLIGDAVWSLLSVPFAITAALIVSQQRDNVIGWLLMVPVCLSIISAPIDYYMKSVATPPAVPGLPFLLMAWFSSWNWLALIFPLLLIPLLFPTGRLLSARWRWVVILAIALCAIFLFNATFSKTMESANTDWTVTNPIGFLEESFFQTILIFWAAGLMVLTISSAASLFVRYRRTGSVEREQIKWLLYACGVFAIIYIPGLWINNLTSGDNSIYANLYNLLFGLTIPTFPVSIAIAILRYRLWNIDLIIRRTLQYGLLTLLLGLVYFGMVVLLGQVFRAITGQDSPLVVVLSTLAIAALFTPLRRWVQTSLDRRFFRQKYDSARALEEFSAAVRREVELGHLTDDLARVLHKTVQPDGVSVWIRDSELKITEEK